MIRYSVSEAAQAVADLDGRDCQRGNRGGIKGHSQGVSGNPTCLCVAGVLQLHHAGFSGLSHAFRRHHFIREDDVAKALVLIVTGGAELRTQHQLRVLRLLGSVVLAGSFGARGIRLRQHQGSQSERD